MQISEQEGTVETGDRPTRLLSGSRKAFASGAFLFGRFQPVCLCVLCGLLSKTIGATGRGDEDKLRCQYALGYSRERLVATFYCRMEGWSEYREVAVERCLACEADSERAMELDASPMRTYLLCSGPTGRMALPVTDIAERSRSKGRVAASYPAQHRPRKRGSAPRLPF